MRIRFTRYTLVLFAFVVVVGCNQSKQPLLSDRPSDKPLPAKTESKPAMIANPASTNCIDKGGSLQIRKRPDGGEYGVCVFAEGREAEEWAMFRGDCPVGGVKVTGYVTEAARFCAITGGTYAVTGNSNTPDEQGTCSFREGKTCDAWEYYRGKCSPNE
jgi:putative hemolysin